MIPTALSIAGSDPSGGAGIQADLKTFMEHGVYGMAAITVLTTQSTQGVEGVHPVDPNLVADQVRAVLEDMPVAAIKIGAVGRSASILQELLANVDVPVVLDPVIRSSSGHPLLPEDHLPALLSLARIASVITPNTPELLELLGQTDPQLWAQETGVAVLHTGGHNKGEEIVDSLHLPCGQCHHLPHQRVHSRATHCTGCTLSSAVTAGLARGWPLDRAVDAAVIFTADLVARSKHHPLGQGNSPLLHGLLRDPE